MTQITPLAMEPYLRQWSLNIFRREFLSVTLTSWWQRHMEKYLLLTCALTCGAIILIIVKLIYLYLSLNLSIIKSKAGMYKGMRMSLPLKLRIGNPFFHLFRVFLLKRFCTWWHAASYYCCFNIINITKMGYLCISKIPYLGIINKWCCLFIKLIFLYLISS